MELREYLRVLRRRAWIPILLVIVTAATAGALTYLSKPEYTATAQVSAKGPSTGGQSASFPEVAVGNNVAKAVVEKLKLSQPPDELSGRIKVSSGKSDLYDITISDADANQAIRIADAVAAAAAIEYQKINSGLGSAQATQVFDEAVQRIRGQYEQQFLEAQKALLSYIRQHPGAAQSADQNVATQAALLQLRAENAADAVKGFSAGATLEDLKQASEANLFQAIVSEQAIARPDTTSRFFKIGYAAALALILGIGLIFVLEYMDTAIRLPEAAEEMIGASVVGIIPRATVQTLRPAKGGSV
jgi:capsular polysaccharide biosynthesis protein